jgi:Kef-type K+ transport system membrane component KefB
MLILALATGIASGGVSVLEIGALVGLAVVFIGLVLLVGTQALRRRPSLLTDPEFAETPFLPGMIVMLGLAALAALIGLAAIIGAFLAGMVVGESSEKHALEEEVAPVAAFFTPFFFGFIGAQVDLSALASLDAVTLLLGVTLLAIATKFVGAFVGAWRAGAARATLIGWGMVPRGEVGVVVAGLGLSAGAITGQLYSVVVGMAIATTLIVPPLLPALVRRAEAQTEGDDPPQAVPGP